MNTIKNVHSPAGMHQPRISKRDVLADLETLLAHATYLHAVAKQTERSWSGFMANVVEYARTSLESEKSSQ